MRVCSANGAIRNHRVGSETSLPDHGTPQSCSEALPRVDLRPWTCVPSRNPVRGWDLQQRRIIRPPLTRCLEKRSLDAALDPACLSVRLTCSLRSRSGGVRLLSRRKRCTIGSIRTITAALRRRNQNCRRSSLPAFAAADLPCAGPDDR
jgi:hypothetical protein